MSRLVKVFGKHGADHGLELGTSRLLTICQGAVVALSILLMIDGPSEGDIHVDFPSNTWLHIIVVLGLALFGGLYLVFLNLANGHTGNASPRQRILSWAATLGLNGLVWTWVITSWPHTSRWELHVAASCKVALLAVADTAFLVREIKDMLGRRPESAWNLRRKVLEEYNAKLLRPQKHLSKNELAGKQEKEHKERFKREKMVAAFAEDNTFFYPNSFMISVIVGFVFTVYAFGVVMRGSREVVDKSDTLVDDLDEAVMILDDVSDICSLKPTGADEAFVKAYDKLCEDLTRADSLRDDLNDFSSEIGDLQHALKIGFYVGPIISFILVLWVLMHHIRSFKEWTVRSWAGRSLISQCATAIHPPSHSTFPYGQKEF